MSRLCVFKNRAGPANGFGTVCLVLRGPDVAIRLLIADSEPVTRIGLSSFFTEPEFDIAVEVDRAAELVRRAGMEAFDVVLTDSEFPDGSGFEAVAALRQSGFDQPILFFAQSSRETSFIRALAAGADSYLVKTTEPMTLIRTVRALAARTDRTPTPGPHTGELARFMVPAKSRTRPQVAFPLTERQIQVLRCVAAGLGNKEIASLLKIKGDTVKEHIRNILQTIDANDRTAAAVWAIRNGLIS